MKKIEECTVNTVDEFFPELVPKLGVQRTPVYRGQRNIDWAILPTLLREDLNRTEFADWASLEATQIMKFKQRSAGLLNCQPQSELEWRAQATHRGLPTALTNWTDNGFVALYFATEKSEDESDGVVWRIVPGETGMEISQDHEQVPNTSGVYFPHHHNRAMENQRICFLTHPLPEGGKHAESFENYYRSSDTNMHLGKIRIPHFEKESIRAKLAMTGTDARALFPDLSGLCSQIQEEIYTHTDSYNWIVEAA